MVRDHIRSHLADPRQFCEGFNTAFRQTLSCKKLKQWMVLLVLCVYLYGIQNEKTKVKWNAV